MSLLGFKWQEKSQIWMNGDNLSSGYTYLLKRGGRKRTRERERQTDVVRTRERQTREGEGERQRGRGRERDQTEGQRNGRK